MKLGLRRTSFGRSHTEPGRVTKEMQSISRALPQFTISCPAHLS
jgi:hypothetical protein